MSRRRRRPPRVIKECNRSSRLGKQIGRALAGCIEPGQVTLGTFSNRPDLHSLLIRPIKSPADEALWAPALDARVQEHTYQVMPYELTPFPLPASLVRSLWEVELFRKFAKLDRLRVDDRQPPEQDPPNPLEHDPAPAGTRGQPE